MPYIDEHGLTWETDEEALGPEMAAALRSNLPPPGYRPDLWGRNALDDGSIRGAASMLEWHAYISKAQPEAKEWDLKDRHLP